MNTGAPKREVDMDTIKTALGWLLALVIVGGLLWYGTIHANNRIREAVSYDRATFCPEIADAAEPVNPADRNCVKVVNAIVDRRDKHDSDDSTTYSIEVRLHGQREHVDVGRELYDGVSVGDEVKVWRFHDRTVGVAHGDASWNTDDTPGPPYLAGMVGTIFWAVAFWLAAAGVLSIGHDRDGEPSPFELGLGFVAAVIAVGLLIVGFLLDEVTDLGEFDPRLVYVSLVLTPAAAVIVMLRALARLGWRRLRAVRK